jgi:hypothetical protein
MRIPKDKKYCSSLDEADQYLDVIKFVPCVHCGKVGFLNRHGFLKGYPPKGSDKLVRGCRIYCSNRNNRNGCGRTCSLLLSTLIIGFSISTGLLWAFMRKVSAGNSIKASWEGLNTGLPVENAYRLWQRLVKEQSRLRTYLSRKTGPPVCASNNPMAQLTAHLNSAFPSSKCCLSAFQEYFQAPLLS